MAQQKKPVIAIVGGIGSGKSVVASAFALHGGRVIQADELGHEALMQPDIRDQVRRRWGPEVFDDQGAVIRRKLGRIVFSAPAEREALESVVYPYIARRLEEEKRRAQADPSVRFIVLDAAVILEAGWTHGLDRLVFVEAPWSLRLSRVQSRGWDETELARREASQMPLAEKKRRADAVIANDGGLDDVRAQVERLLREWDLMASAGED